MSDEKMDWKQRVADSKGQQIFVPDTCLPSTKEWFEKRGELNTFIDKAARTEIETNMSLNAAIYEIRKYLSENGRTDIWTSDIAFDTDALKEGKFIVTITQNLPGK